MSVHAHTHTRAHKDRQDKGKRDKQKERSWKKTPDVLGEGCLQQHLVLLREIHPGHICIGEPES